MSSTRGPSALRSNVATIVSREAAGRVRPDVDVGAQVLEEPRRPAADLADALGRVRPAIDVDEPFEVGEIPAQIGRDGRPKSFELEIGGRSGRLGRHRGQSTDRSGCYPAGTVRVVEIRMLEGPNVYRLEPVVKLELAVGRRRTWYGQRDPGRHALVQLGAAVPARDWPDPIAAIVAWVRRLRADHDEGRGGLAVHRSSDPGHWIDHLSRGKARSEHGS